MTTWSCIVPGRPKTKGNSKRIVRMGARLRVIGSTSALKAESDARSVIAAHAPPAPLQGALRCTVVFVFAIPQGKRKGKHKIEPGAPCLLKVDRGNLLKLIEDAMNGLVYDDDSQIVSGDVSKVWGDVDETQIHVETFYL